MNELIRGKLIEIEDTFHVKVLYAVESGSRAWGIPSAASDYDVRFIYIHHPHWYLSIDPQGIGMKKDVIELPINNFLDISGWELTKALRLFRKSNPSFLEWMKSDIIYVQESSFIQKLRSLETEIFDPTASLHHYINMAKKNSRDYLQDPKVKMKTYFYALRSIVACKWIEKYKTVPAINFTELMEAVIVDPALIHEIDVLIAGKKAGGDFETGPKLQLTHHFLETEIVRMEAYLKTLPSTTKDSTEKLDELFRCTLKEFWG